LGCYFVPYTETEIKKIPAEDLEHLSKNIEPLFIFSLVWSVGATTTYEGRA